MKDKILNMVRESAAREKPYGWLNYQPINLPGYEETLPLRGRDCFDRSKAVFPHIKKNLGDGQLSLVDWGCNIGFFVFEAAKLGYVASGYDADPRLIEANKYLATSNEFRFTPTFQVKKLTLETLNASPRTDVLICMSVLHHMKELERYRVIEAMSNQCTAAYIELDGSGFGRAALEMFFWKVEEIVETNDRYGNSRRARKTWYCTNHDGEKTYRNLKERDFMHDRALFLSTGKSGPKTVVKRERIGNTQDLHRWLKTGLPHEREIHEKYASPYFPTLISAGEGEKYRFIELEFLEKRGPVPPQAVDELFAWLEKTGLFIIDFRVERFLPSNGRLRMIDLESVFPIEGTIKDTVARQVKDQVWRPKGLDNYDTHEKQRQAVKRALCR